MLLVSRCLVAMGMGVVLCGRVQAQPPQKVEPRKTWDDNDYRAHEIEQLAAGQTTTLKYFLQAVTRARWDEAALCVAGVAQDAPAIAQVKRLAGLDREPVLWSLDERRLINAVDGALDLNPHAETIDIDLTLVTTDTLGIDLFITEKVRLKLDKIWWRAGMRHEADVARIWRIVPPDGAHWNLRAGPINTYARLFCDENFTVEKLGAERSMKQARQLAFAISMFAQDFDDKYDFDGLTWREKVTSYVASLSLFTAPGDTGEKTSYSVNDKLFGQLTTAVKDPDKTVLLYLGQKGQLDYRFNGRAPVAFADGHVEFVSPGAKLRWDP